jgi:hypothetical protein
MKLIRQRGKKDCSLACLAMVKHGTYAAALRARPWFVRGVWRDRMLEALAGEWLHESPVVTLIKEPGGSFGHWVVLVGSTVYDPEYRRPVALKRYARRRWLVLFKIGRAAGEVVLLPSARRPLDSA